MLGFGSKDGPWDQPTPVTHTHYAAVEPSADLTARLFQGRGREDDWEVEAVSDYLDLPKVCHHAYHLISGQLERDFPKQRAVVVSSLYTQDRKDHIYVTPERTKSPRFEEVLRGIAKELNIPLQEEESRMSNGRHWECTLFIGKDKDDSERLWMRYLPKYTLVHLGPKDVLGAEEDRS